MSISEPELAQILVHCRDLLDAATQLSGLAAGRYQAAFEATRQWTGEHGETFAARMATESEDLAARSRELKHDADAWARVWADSVDAINGQRREAAVEDARSRRGFGEQVIDVINGDDSGDLVPPFVSVSVPTAVDRYAATGGLASF